MVFWDKIKKIPLKKGVLRKWLQQREKSKTEDKTFNFTITEPRHLLIIPEIDDVKKTNVQYPLLEPFCYAHIFWSKTKEKLIYKVVEPVLNEEEEENYKKIVNALVEIIDVQLSGLKDPSKAIEYIQNNIKIVLEELDIKMSKTEISKIMYYVYKSFVGLNKIEPFIHDPFIEDIGADGVGVPIYVVHKKFGSLETNVTYEDEEELKDFVVKLAERCGRYISYAEPLLDGTLPDGSRIQASLAGDVTTKGPTFSIRKFEKEPFSPIDLIEFGTASPGVMAYLWFCIENGLSILICGGVATGKTSMLNAISLFIQPEYKIVSIEDTRELSLPHSNWIPAVARLGFGESERGKKYGEVTMFDLLKESFRQNPNYVIVGEIRGKEAYVMFQGMASGNPSLGTMHAGGYSTVIKRLQSPPIELSSSLVETLDLVITMVRAKQKGENARRIKDITEIKSVSGYEADVNIVFRWDPNEDSFEFGGGEWVLKKISKSKGLPLSKIKKEIDRREIILEWMLRKGIKNWKDVSRIISEYYKNPKSVIKKVKSG